MPASARPASTTEQLVENVKAFVDAINRAKPTGAKGTYLKRAQPQLDHGPGRQARRRRAWSVAEMPAASGNGGCADAAAPLCCDCPRTLSARATRRNVPGVGCLGHEAPCALLAGPSGQAGSPARTAGRGASGECVGDTVLRAEKASGRRSRAVFTGLASSWSRTTRASGRRDDGLRGADEAGGRFRVTKNRLARSRWTGRPAEMGDLFTGPTAIAYSRTRSRRRKAVEFAKSTRSVSSAVGSGAPCSTPASPGPGRHAVAGGVHRSIWSAFGSPAGPPGGPIGARPRNRGDLTAREEREAA